VSSRDPASDRHLLCFENEIQRMAREVGSWDDIETGGDLFGFWTHSGAPAVHYVLGPGPGARREVTAFFQDRAYLEAEATRLNDMYGLQHIGEWHSHHRLGLNEPSGGDARTVRRALDRYGFERFALIICTLDGPRGSPVVRLNPYLFESGIEPHVCCPWAVLPGASPIRGVEKGLSDDAVSSQRVGCHLHPSSTTMAELRDGSPRSDPIESLGDHWYTTDTGQRRLKLELEAMENHQFTVRMRVDDRDRIVFDVTGSGRSGSYRLMPGYPTEAPVVLGPVLDDPDQQRRERFRIQEAWRPGASVASLHAFVLRGRERERVVGADHGAPHTRSVESTPVQTFEPTRRSGDDHGDSE
jgi:hypothetical protein